MNTTEAQRQNRSALEAELRAAGAIIRGNAVQCPFHEDRHPSASIYQGQDGVWRFKCNAASCGFGSDLYDVRARATGRPVEDVLRDERPKAQPQRREKMYLTLDDVRGAIGAAGHIEAEYRYGPDMIVFRIRTYKGKTFRQASRRSAPAGWVLKAPDKPWPLYRRREIAVAKAVIVVEGEKCVEALISIGITNATAIPCGAGKAEHCDLSPLADKRVYLWPDNDTVGRNHMKQVMALLDKLTPACDVRVIEPTDVDLDGEHEDVADLISMCQKVDMDPVGEIKRARAIAKSFTLSSGLRDRIEDTISGKWADLA